MDGSGQEVGNVVVTVAYPEPLVRQANKVVVHNKINNLPGFTNYICNPICIRVADPMEGGDRVPLQNLSMWHSKYELKLAHIHAAPAGTSP